VLAQESKYHLLNCQNEISQSHVDRMVAEIKFYISTDAAERKKSLREQYTQQIHEQEKLGKSLREEHKTVRDNQAANELQMKMWNDLKQLLDLKRKSAAYDR
jgi:intraflagellar transport protein 81